MCNCPKLRDLGEWEPIITAADESFVERGGVIVHHAFVDPNGRFVPSHSVTWYNDPYFALLKSVEWCIDRTETNRRMVERAG